jgi:hypothetical protein
VNTRREILDWFEPSCEAIVIHPVLMYYAIEIDSSLFLSGSFDVFFRDFRIVPGFLGLFPGFSGLFRVALDVDPSSLFIAGEPLHRV